ncbi:MAG: hypothetical protein LBH57_04060 [Treponema sp.]|jgi:hypothetical protein|nr:hypothetical protein [Treponema sp.]
MEVRFPPQSLSAAFGEQDMNLSRTRRFLAGIAVLPPIIQEDLPVLTDIAALCAGTRPGAEPEAAALWGPVRRGLNRRYLRIRFVQGELERLDFKKAKPGVMFSDFVFDQIDFSAYKKIPAEEYSLYAQEGPEDFEPSFFMRNFRLSRDKTRALINGAYTRIGGFYYIRQEKMLSNPLLMSILRTLQTSLEFNPLFTQEAVRDEYRAVLRSLRRHGEPEGDIAFPQEEEVNRLFTSLLRALHGAAMIHGEGVKTELTAVQEENALLLKGAFHPHGKAYTVTLVKSRAE